MVASWCGASIVANSASSDNLIILSRYLHGNRGEGEGEGEEGEEEGKGGGGGGGRGGGGEEEAQDNLSTVHYVQECRIRLCQPSLRACIYSAQGHC